MEGRERVGEGGGREGRGERGEGERVGWRERRDEGKGGGGR